MRRKIFPLVVLPALAIAGCGSPPEPVGAVAVDRGEIELPHGAWQRLELTWRMTRPLSGLEGEPRVMLHLLDGAGELVRTFDHPLPGGWRPGEEATYGAEIFQSALAPALEPGSYDLAVGLYDSAGHRWALESAGEELRGGAYRVARVRAAAAAAGLPEFSFSAEWLPTERGVDRQILARRWLSGDGVIRVRGIGGPGAVWLRFGIPAAGELQELVVEPAAAQPAATVKADCSGFSAALEGSRSHVLEVPLTPDGDPPGECRVRFRANFELLSKTNREKRTIALENLAWRAE